MSAAASVQWQRRGTESSQSCHRILHAGFMSNTTRLLNTSRNRKLAAEAPGALAFQVGLSPAAPSAAMSFASACNNRKSSFAVRHGKHSCICLKRSAAASVVCSRCCLSSLKKAGRLQGKDLTSDCRSCRRHHAPPASACAAQGRRFRQLLFDCAGCARRKRAILVGSAGLQQRGLVLHAASLVMLKCPGLRPSIAPHVCICNQEQLATVWRQLSC